MCEEGVNRNCLMHIHKTLHMVATKNVYYLAAVNPFSPETWPEG